MDALDLIVVGRRLARIGERAMRGSGAPALPGGMRLVLADVLGHPDSAIGDVARRTGLPQSYVSEVVARLRDPGVVETRADPGDGRRTLVRIAPRKEAEVARLGAVPVDAQLAEALGDVAPDELARTLETLERLALRLAPAESSPAGRLRARRSRDAA